MTNGKVGIIGVGLMGHGIAMNVASKGWALGFLDHPGNQPTDDLVALGATAYADQSQLAQDHDVIILCVSGTPQVEAVLLGGNGVLQSIRPGTIIIDCSTALPSSTQEIARATQQAGGRFLDAAMTRTPREAAQGRLNLLVGGDQALFEQVKPLLSTFAENMFYAGPAGSGHTLKLLHNFVSLGFVTLLSEAAACARQGGIEPDVLVDVLAKGGGYGAALDRVAPFLLENDTSRLRFSVANASKDLSYYLQMADAIGARSQSAQGVAGALKALVDDGRGDAYLATLAAEFSSPVSPSPSSQGNP